MMIGMIVVAVIMVRAVRTVGLSDPCPFSPLFSPLYSP